MALEDQKYLKVYFADESGFCLNPSVPYGWQPCGKYNCIVPQKSDRRNVFGLLSRDNDFEGYDTCKTFNAELLAACIDDFSAKITQKTVVVIDNASFHHADAIHNKIQEWQEKDLYIWFLPKYSPHLNIIEILWRKVKYQWLKPHHYLDWNTLNNALDEIFTNIGSKYTIEFK